MFSLLCASNYHYNKRTIRLELFKCKTTHSNFLHIAVIQSILLQWVINIVPIYIIVRYTWIGTFSAILYWHTMILLFLLCFILNCHGTLLSSQISILFFCGISEHNFIAVVKEIHKLQFQSTTTSADTKFLLPKPIYHWKTEQYWGSVHHIEVDIESEVNCLYSGNIWQYTTVPSQCEQLPWTWTFRILYLCR